MSCRLNILLLIAASIFLIPAFAQAQTCNGQACTITCTEFVTCEGTKGDDVICGTDQPDFIKGSFGDDTICGGAGGDTILSGWGDDTVFGEGGGDFILSGHCNDTIDGGDDTETACQGGLGDDSISNCDGIEDFGQETSETGGNCD